MLTSALKPMLNAAEAMPFAIAMAASFSTKQAHMTACRGHFITGHEAHKCLLVILRDRRQTNHVHHRTLEQCLV